VPLRAGRIRKRFNLLPVRVLQDMQQHAVKWGVVGAVFFFPSCSVNTGSFDDHATWL
jgi:hypothetical protein